MDSVTSGQITVSTTIPQPPYATVQEKMTAGLWAALAEQGLVLSSAVEIMRRQVEQNTDIIKLLTVQNEMLEKLVKASTPAITKLDVPTQPSRGRK